jgi:hypothetical protein
MSFELTHTMLTDHISELHWGAAPEVGFTYFDSCLGLLGRDGNDVIGVHLVMATDGFFDDEAAALAASVVLRCSEVAVVGNLRLWEDSVPGPYRTMAGLIGGAWRPMTDRGRGTYGGRINAGRVQYRYNGVWYNH